MSKLLRIPGFLSYSLLLFLNAFVDLGHKIIIQNTIFKIQSGETQVVLTAIINALILLPFILLFTPAGFLSDKYPKPRIMRLSAIAAVVVAGFICVSYYAGWFWCAFALTLVLASQSAIYSPAKYGFIREMTGEKNLAPANAWVQAVTVIAILSGAFVFSAIFEQLLVGRELIDGNNVLQSIAPIGWILIGLTLCEVAAAFRLPEIPAAAPNKQFRLHEYLRGKYLRNNTTAIYQSNPVWLSIIGLSIFWAVSQVLLATFPAFAKEVLAESNTLVIQGILACSGVGILFGSLFAGRVSRNYIELGLVPVGAIGIAVSLAILPALENHWAMVFSLVALGFLGGILIVPLNALIQFHADKKSLASVLAGNNWVQNITMLSFLILTVVFALSGMNSQWLLIGLAIIALIGAVYTLYKLPHSLVRLLVSIIMRRRYNMHVLGFENLPRDGAALLLGNHVSWIDWAMLQIACPRPVRFVMSRSIYERWYLQPLLKRFAVIPISPGQSRNALRTVSECLQAGEVVCLFPEGCTSLNGSLGRFHNGYERAIKGISNAVIVPFYLHGLWGSRFSRSGSENPGDSKRTVSKRDIVVVFGQPLHCTTSAGEVKQVVTELAVSAWNYQLKSCDPLPLAWIRQARQHWRKPSVIDSDGARLSNGRMLAAVATFARAMRKISPEQNIGLLLPASSAAIISNMAVLLNGQTAVNLNFTTGIDAIRSSINSAEIKTIYTSSRFLARLHQKGVDSDAMLQGMQVVPLEEVKARLSKPRFLLNLCLARVLPASCFYRLSGRKVGNMHAAAILFSSGSEGRPKGIVLSHRNILTNIKQISNRLNTEANDRIMGSLPPFHSFGLTVTSLLPLVEGIPVVCYPDPTDVVNIAKLVHKYRVTVLCATATFLRLYGNNNKVSPLMLESLRLVVAGAEKLNRSVRDNFKVKFNKEIYEGYGTTETAPVACVSIPDKIDGHSWSVQTGNKHNSVGMPVAGCCIRVVHPDTFKSLPAGEDGLILIAGGQVMSGYLNDQEKTDAVIVELDGHRWYASGDKGHLDEDGFLTIVDRFSRFAKIGGEMISLGAVEEKIREILNSDIEMVAVNVPDKRKGEKVVLLTEDTASAEKIKKQLIEQGCHPMMIPSDIINVAMVPKLGSGKSDFGGARALANEWINRP